MRSMSKSKPLRKHPDNIWFTSDTHFLHENICILSDRPFDSVSEMTEHIVEVWNDRVKPDDLVYHLGDFACSYGKKDAGAIDDLIRRLNGNKTLIIGNHDRKEVTENKRWARVERMHEIKIDLGGEHNQRIVLCHYPLRSWNQNHRGSWMLHGHCHGNLPDPGGKTIDVGVDCCHRYGPISLADIAVIMSRRSVELPGDHHQ